MKTIQYMLFNTMLLCSAVTVKPDVVIQQQPQSIGPSLRDHCKKQDKQIKTAKDILLEVTHKKIDSSYTNKEEQFDKKRLMQAMHEIFENEITYNIQDYATTFSVLAAYAFAFSIVDIGFHARALYENFFQNKSSLFSYIKNNNFTADAIFLPIAALSGLGSYFSKKMLHTTRKINAAFTEHMNMYSIADHDIFDIPTVFFDIILDTIEAHETESYTMPTGLKSSIQNYRHAIQEHIKMCQA